MSRTATCACGQLSITLQGDPDFVLTCSCLKCQRRTGSVFGVSAYFNDANIIEQQGQSQPYRLTSESGGKTERHFCPTCGTTVHWTSDFMSTHTGIPVGAFSDPTFPEPSMAAWNQSKHPWVTFPEYWRCSDTQKFGEADA